MGIEKKIKILILLIVDVFIINMSYFVAFYIRYLLDVPQQQLQVYYKTIPLITLLYLIPLFAFKMYRSIWKIAGFDEFINGVIASFLGLFLNVILVAILPNKISIIVTVVAGILIMALTISIRMSFRIYRRIILFGSIKKGSPKKNVLIIGAGACGQIMLNEMKKQPKAEYKIIGFIDDDKNKKNTYLGGVKVLGTRNDILKIVSENRVDLIIISIPSIGAESKKELIEICQDTKIQIKIVPGIYELIGTDVNISKIRNVDLKDLLGREEISLDKEGIKDYITNKIVLVTGGGGSIGSELCRQIAQFKPKLLLILDIYENSTYELQNELRKNYPNLKKHVLIASVRDRKRMNHIFETYRPNVVFHAAAHKHVPLMEFNPGEAIKNNVVGTLNTAECASKYGAERFVLISTDKAVNPTNVMGATKRMCEMVVQALDKESKTDFVAVRFGNVLGSNGSVIPLFKKQIEEGGPLTLTHKDITRYFMLIPEAAQLVLQAGAYAKGGEIFVLDMGKPVKIYDLAEDLIRLSGYQPHKDIEIKITGLRPGEKLYEELLMSEEGLINTKHEKIFIGRPGTFDITKVKKNINELVILSEKGSKERLKTKLEEFVPTYIRTDNN